MTAVIMMSQKYSCNIGMNRGDRVNMGIHSKKGEMGSCLMGIKV